MKPEYWDRARRSLARRDPVMGAIMRRHPRVYMMVRGEPFMTLARAICGQQISVKAAQSVLAKVDLDVLDRANAALYWERESRHDTVISLTYGRPALEAFCRVLELWIEHFLSVKVQIKPVRKIDEPRWAWHIGLDAESTAILNELWAGSEIEQGRMRNILAIFALQFDEPAAMRADIAGRTVYLALACEEGGVVRMKPQNLLTNLPLREA